MQLPDIHGFCGLSHTLAGKVAPFVGTSEKRIAWTKLCRWIDRSKVAIAENRYSMHTQNTKILKKMLQEA